MPQSLLSWCGQRAPCITAHCAVWINITKHRNTSVFESFQVIREVLSSAGSRQSSWKEISPSAFHFWAKSACFCCCPSLHLCRWGWLSTQLSVCPRQQIPSTQGPLWAHPLCGGEFNKLSPSGGQDLDVKTEECLAGIHWAVNQIKNLAASKPSNCKLWVAACASTRTPFPRGAG